MPLAAKSFYLPAERLLNSYDPVKRRLGSRLRAEVTRCLTAPGFHWLHCLTAVCVARRTVWKYEGETCDGCRQWQPTERLLVVMVRAPQVPASEGEAVLCDDCRQIALFAPTRG